VIEKESHLSAIDLFFLGYLHQADSSDQPDASVHSLWTYVSLTIMYVYNFVKE